MHAYVHTYIRTLHYITITVTITLTLHYTTLHYIPFHYTHYIYIYTYIQSYDHPSWNRIKSYLIPSFFLIFVCIYFKFDRVYVYIVFQHQIS